MSGENENGTPGERPDAPANTEHLNIKVTDNNNEVFFKIKRTTKLEKLMGAFCERQGKALSSVRFLFDGTRVQPTDTPDAVRLLRLLFPSLCPPGQSRLLSILWIAQEGSKSLTDTFFFKLEMQDGDTLEVHQEQVGGGSLL
ncbi:hypothetical protein ACJZ2D_009840 [Fusarium nematophilum]